MTFVLFLLCGAMGARVSPVQKVIQLLEELQGKVEADLATEAEQTEACKEMTAGQQNEKEDAITSSKRDISDLQATIQDSQATIGTLTSSIDKLTNKISTSEAELQDATEIRQKARADFAAAEKELVDTVDSLDRASAALKKNLGLLQSGKVRQVMSAMAGGLQKIVEASWVNAHQKQVLQSLLQAQTSQSDEDTQPQSGGILDTIADMAEKAEDALGSARKDEMEQNHAYEMVKQGLDDEIKVAKKQLAEATLHRSETQEELNSAEVGLAEAQQNLAADEDFLAELKQFIANKASSWAQRQKQAKEEMAAINMAKETLSSGVKVLLQTSSRVVKKSLSTGVRERVAGVLKGLAKEFHSYALMQVSNSAKSDPFGKIRGLIESMIDKLEKQAAEEADQKAFCDEENGKSRSKKADLSGKLDKNTARIQKAEAGKAQLAEAIQQLEAEIADIDAGQAEATKLRQDEHAEYLTASKDYKDSAAAVAKAIQQLSDYYNSASLLQIRTTTRRSKLSFLQLRTTTRDTKYGGPSTDVGSTIISLLEVAESDFTRLLAEAEAEESASQDEQEKLTQENKVGKITKQGAAKGKSQEAKQLEVALDNYKDDRQSTSSELDAVLSYLDKLKPQCETKVESYGEKKARREKEISGLQEALTILSGEA